MKIMFWNVQRLGAATDERRREVFRAMYNERVPDLNYVFLCELTTGADFPTPYNLTYRRRNTAQLCYGAIDCATGHAIVLTQFNPWSTDEFEQAGFKGGTRFSNFTDRAVAYAGQLDGVHVYVYHAPASNNAKKAVSFLVCCLHEHHGDDPWLLIGDLNVEPDELAASQVGIELADLIETPGVPTHIGARDTLLDYAMCNFGDDLTVARIRCSPRALTSDHYPIVVSW